MHSKLLYILLFVCTLLTAACSDDDKWTTSPSAGFVFSADTIRFDTIITGQSSSTRTLVAFNHGGDGLRRISARLRDGKQSHFRVNVDGQYLHDGLGDDFQVRGKDSMMVRLEVLLPEVGDTIIRHYEDRLIFTLESGVSQEIVLEADGMDVRILRGKVIDGEETLTKGMPYLIYDSLCVAPNATLTLEPGCRLLFHDKVSLHVHGSVRAIGTLEEPIILRGDRMDRMFANLPYDNTPNRWGGVHFYGDSHDNILEHCDIHSGDYGILCDSTFLPTPFMPILSMWNCVIHNIGGTGLALRSTKVEVVGSQISNCLMHCVDILGGDVFMLHCTIAQFFAIGAFGQDALYLSNLDEADHLVPIHQAGFVNCVITGFADDVVMGHLASEEDEPCNYLFDHCFLRTVKSDDTERFVECVYDDKELEPNYRDHFVRIDTRDAFLYDFSPWSNSVICTTGRADYTLDFLPEDRLGRPFIITGDKSVCGAYASVPKPEEK